MLILEKLAEQRLLRDELEELIEEKCQVVATRLMAKDEVGAILAMEKVLRYRAKHEWVIQTIMKLNDLALESAKTAVANHNDGLYSILSAPEPDLEVNDACHILQEAQKCFTANAIIARSAVRPRHCEKRECRFRASI